MRKILVMTMFVAMATFASACTGGGDDDDDDDDHGVVSVALSPSNPTVEVGSTLQLTATATLEDLHTEVVTADSTWTSSTGGVATVSAGGLVTGVAVGETTISATHDDVTGTVVVEVVAAFVDFAFDVVNWSAHNGASAFVRVLDGTEQVACTETPAISGGTANITLTGVLVEGREYTYEAFADEDDNDEWNATAAEHRWTGAFVGGDSVTIDHNTDTQAAGLTWTVGQGCS